MRLFLGIPAPPSPVYEEVTQRLVGAHPDVRPVPAGTWHVTLRFLGEVADPGNLEGAVESALEGVRAMPCRVQGVGGFPSADRARVVWAGVEADGLRDVEARIRNATALYGMPPEKRPFHAHVTLARSRVPVDLSLQWNDLKDVPFAEGVLDRVVLWRSTLTPQRPRYEETASWALR